jgi:hypothetical protein
VRWGGRLRRGRGSSQVLRGRRGGIPEVSEQVSTVRVGRGGEEEGGRGGRQQLTIMGVNHRRAYVTTPPTEGSGTRNAVSLNPKSAATESMKEDEALLGSEGVEKRTTAAGFPDPARVVNASMTSYGSAALVILTGEAMG